MLLVSPTHCAICD